MRICLGPLGSVNAFFWPVLECEDSLLKCGERHDSVMYIHINQSEGYWMTISERIFQIMEERGLTLYRLSKITGISYQTMNDWKKKNTNPGADKIMLLCAALEVTPEMLLTGKGIEETVDVISNEMETDSEEDVLLAYRELSASKKKRLLAYISMLQNTK